jgi:multidrug resistance efflux pump
MKLQHVSGNIAEKLPKGIKSPDLIYEKERKRYTQRWLWVLLGVILVFLFLPWTQNIRSTGFVTTIDQEDRPQNVVSQIPGKILKWYVREGDFVKVGDTLLQLGEVKDEYLDPQLVERTQNQIDENANKTRFYSDKIQAVDQQIATLQQQLDLKLKSLTNKRTQIERKIEAKKVEIEAAKVDLKQGEDQLQRAKVMLEKEAISKFDYERRNASYVKAMSALTDKQNELDNFKQDLILNTLEVSNAKQEYAEKIVKLQGDQFTISSNVAEAREKIAVLSNKKQSIVRRADYYYLLSPQNGQVIKARKSGLNEIVKEGEMIVEIVPQDIRYAVEMFISPMDLPLVDTGQKVRFIFDGFPAIVFSGWPNASTGTFGGKILAVEGNRSINGKFRVLVSEDKTERPWPKSLKLGNGATGIALLNNVPIWYELWRNINGFPADFYKEEEDKNTSAKK